MQLKRIIAWSSSLPLMCVFFQSSGYAFDSYKHAYLSYLKQNRTEHICKRLVSVFGTRQSVRPRLDCAESSIWSGSSLFAYRIFYLKLTKNLNIPCKNPKLENGLVQVIMIEKSIQLIWVKIPLPISTSVWQFISSFSLMRPVTELWIQI